MQFTNLVCVHWNDNGNRALG